MINLKVGELKFEFLGKIRRIYKSLKKIYKVWWDFKKELKKFIRFYGNI